MKLQGTITRVLPLTEGVSQAGKPWRRQDYVLTTPGTYPRTVCFSLMGDRIDQYPLREGMEVTAEVDIDSREYNGRWYTSVTAWKVDGAAQVPAPQPAVADSAPQQPTSEPVPDPDGLPF